MGEKCNRLWSSGQEKKRLNHIENYSHLNILIIESLLILNILNKNGFNRKKHLAPRPLYYDNQTTFQLYEELPGLVLIEALQKNKRGSLKFIKLSAQLLYKVHNLKIKNKIKISRKRRDNYLFSNLKKVQKKLASEKIIVQKLNQVYNFLKKQVGYLENKKSSLVHGDLNPFNIIVDKNKVGLVDFEKAHLNHPLFDVASFVTHLITIKEFHLKKSLKRYSKTEVNQLGQAFLKQYLKKYGPFSLKDQLAFAYFEIYFYLLATLHIILFDWPNHLKKKQLLNIINGRLKIMNKNIKFIKQRSYAKK